jgi:hypothetical protein
VLVSKVSLTVSFGVSDAAANGLFNNAIFKLKPSGPVITIGANVLSSNKWSNLNLDNRLLLVVRCLPSLTGSIVTKVYVIDGKPMLSSLIPTLVALGVRNNHSISKRKTALKKRIL